ncbi:pentatricopeptide repeat-containing protein At3g14330-like [Castanea sativa]|uniref:pentatricopeptide repeat-containing protein At3g14330-like n=1 Tax=Castanea sativa TaxID=21020 RepID=UPI003F65065D
MGFRCESWRRNYSKLNNCLLPTTRGALKWVHRPGVVYDQLHLLLSRDKGNHDLLKNPTIKTKFITLFSVCGLMDEALGVFEDGLEHELVPESVWVAMAIGFSKNGHSKEALLIYCGMLSRLVQPGNFAFSMALKACADLCELRVGKAVHAQIMKCNEEPDQVVNNALLRLYTECGCFDEVLFTENKCLDHWTLSGECKERRLDSVGLLLQVLPVYSQLTVLNSGKEIHAQIVKSTRKPDVPVLNSLMDMYAKCGATDYSRRVFDGMQSEDLTSWNTMLTGYAVNGCLQKAMEIFNEMVECGIRPDAVTFIALLSGCSHAGLTDEGQRLFNKMKKNYGLSPSVEHYACLVDMLGRAGRIKEALEVVKFMPMKPIGSIWGSLLNSCRLHGNVSLGEAIAEQLFELEPNNPGNYVLLSNIYANAGMWGNVKIVRNMMERRGMKKEAGCSWVQIKNRIHTFVAGGGFEFRNSAEYKKVWNQLMDAMEAFGYVPNTGVVLHDVNEATKSIWLCGNSERLATVFSLIHSSSGAPIRITKNLRVCVDCHTWMKIVSSVTRRVIVLRDTNRFHHFRGGACSFKDYW